VLDAIISSATSSTVSFSSDCCAHAHRRRWGIVGESAAMIGHWREVGSSALVTEILLSVCRPTLAAAIETLNVVSKDVPVAEAVGERAITNVVAAWAIDVEIVLSCGGDEVDSASRADCR
jgi:hypothetical protein